MECNSMNLFLLLKLVNEKAGTDKGKYLSEIWLKEIKNPSKWGQVLPQKVQSAYSYIYE